MFMRAQLISPVSISAMLAAIALDPSLAEASYKLDRRFAVVLAFVVMGYLLVAGRWLWLATAPASS
jgi:hypothetical protein